MTLLFLFQLLLVALAVANKTEDCSTFKALETPLAWNDFNQLVQSEMQFTADICRKLGMRRSSDNVNVAFTPFNIYNSLLVMYFMSANRTEQIIGEMFHIPKNQTKSSIHAIYNTLTLHKRSSIDVKIKEKQRNAYRNKKENNRVQFINEEFGIFLSNKFKVKSCAMKFFEKKIVLVDFEKPNETLDTMNEWVTNKTGYTEESLQPHSFDNYTHVLFANTALFHGVWKQPLKALKHNSDFRKVDGTKKNVTLMVLSGRFKTWFDKDLDADILELPYQGNIYKVLILLPRHESPTVIAQLLKSLSKQKLSDFITNRTQVQMSNIEVEIPKFKLEKTYDLVKTMQYMGFKKFFESPFDMSNILDQPNKKQTTKFRIKAVYTVKVQFDSTSQAKSKYTPKGYKIQSSAKPPGLPVIRADHPFVYFIYTSTNLIVLGGVLYNP